jgi:hypothetical protein
MFEVLNLNKLFLDSIAFTNFCLQLSEVYGVFNFDSNIVTCISDYRRVFQLDDWVYWHIHSTRDYRQYSAIADLHTFQFTVTHALGFSVFFRRIQAKDL